MEAGECDVRVVGPVFWGEAAAGHGGGDFFLEIEESACGFDLCEEDASSREGVNANEFEWKGGEVEFGEFAFDVRERGFGDFVLKRPG